MDKETKELESLVKSQKEQLTRYETRLKDVVAAYKGLLKEKEALEQSLTAVSTNKPSPVHEVRHPETPPDGGGGGEDLQVQIATLMNSLATLSAEKSRQEASFQADKKQLRQELTVKDKMIRDLQEKVKQVAARQNVETEQVKSKLIVEKHERDKEAQDHMVMVRELQKLLSDERHLKESLEMQLNNLKTQFSQMHAPDKTIRDLIQELDVTKKALKQSESRKSVRDEATDMIFQQLQEEMQNLKQQHAVAIRNEQKRALMAEETNRKLAAQHEERVASLEARLSELSATVGSYDRLRQQDQESIMKLKEKLVKLSALTKPFEEERRRSSDIHGIVDEILQLKKKLVNENAKAEHPFDVSKIFATQDSTSNVPKDVIPLADFQRIKSECDRLIDENDNVRFSLEEQKAHIRTLQEKVKVLNRNIDEHENEMKTKNLELAQILKSEKNKWRDAIAQIENEYRSRVAQLETELQKQRERSLQLLDEKESEIKTLKASFEIFIPGNTQMMNTVQENEATSDGEYKPSHLSTILSSGKPMSASQPESFHMLHYAHELARKDVEIVSLRKAKHSTESALRQALQAKVTIQEELHEKVSNLEDEVDRLNRYQSREGANLEYLKNVILSYLVSKDPDSRKHMLNAIGAVLKFSPAEMNSISTFLSGKK